MIQLWYLSLFCDIIDKNVWIFVLKTGCHFSEPQSLANDLCPWFLNFLEIIHTLFLLCLLPWNAPFTLSRDKLSIAGVSIVFMSTEDNSGDLVTQHRLYLLHPLGASNARLLVACCATLRNFLTLVLKMPGSCRCLHDPTNYLTTSHVTRVWNAMVQHLSRIFGRTISHHDQKVIVCFYPRQKNRDSC